jgi:hypothetical protein
VGRSSLAGPDGTGRAAGVCHDAIADCVIPPGTWTAPAVPRPLARIRGARRFGIGEAGAPPRVHPPQVVGHGLGCFHLRRGRGLGLLLRQWTRMHHHKA